MVKLSQLTRDEPQSPMETAIWWVEYVIRNKGSSFRVSSLDIPWYQYFLLDIVVYLVVTLLLLGFTVLKLIQKIKYFFSTTFIVLKCDKVD